MKPDQIIQLIQALAPLALELIRMGEAALGMQMATHVNDLALQAKTSQKETA